MTANLTFNLPEDSTDHQTAIDGWKWKSLVREILDNLRQDLKYNSDNLSPEQLRILENMKTMIHSRMTEENLSIND